VPVDVGAAELTVALVQDGVETPVFEGPVALDAGQRFVVEAVDEPPPPGVAAGKEVFADRSRGGCGVCHSTERGDDGVGPSLYGVADAAATRRPGMDAAAYLRESVLDPDAFIVPGYRAGQMLPTYRERLSDAEVDALVEYLLTLRGEVGDEEGS
jgi:mono/diheme cytochrome c family protein